MGTVRHRRGAHCVSQWGHDFGRSTASSRCCTSGFPSIPRVALTATAGCADRSEIVERLQLEDARQFVSSFDRPNIRYYHRRKQNSHPQLLQFLQEHRNEAGIVPAFAQEGRRTRRTLVQSGFDALPYHAGLDAATRARNQDRFIREEGVIVVATIALAWASTNPMSALWRTSICQKESMEGYYQKPAARSRRLAGRCVGWPLCMGDVVTSNKWWKTPRPAGNASAWSGKNWKHCWACANPLRAAARPLLGYFGERLVKRSMATATIVWIRLNLRRHHPRANGAFGRGAHRAALAWRT